MNELNIALRVRSALKLTPTEAGVLLFGYNNLMAYKMWRRWETGTAISKPLESHFNLILHMINTLGIKATKKLIGGLHD